MSLEPKNKGSSVDRQAAARAVPARQAPKAELIKEELAAMVRAVDREFDLVIEKAIEGERAFVRAEPAIARLFIDSDGKTYRSKRDLVDEDHGPGPAPLATFEYSKKFVGPLAAAGRVRGELTVQSGLPARNSTQVLSLAGAERAGQLVELSGPLVVTTGTIFMLPGDFSFSIPRRVARRPSTCQELAENLIATAPLNVDVPLGRNSVPGLNSYISRKHCSARVLERNEHPDGSFDLVVEVFPGARGHRDIAIKLANGEERAVAGRTSLAPGSTVLLGDGIGAVPLPLEEGPIRKMMRGVAESVGAGDDARAVSMVESFRSVQAPELFPVADAGVSRRPPAVSQERQERAAIVRELLVQALAMVRSGASRQAILLMSSPAAAVPFEQLNYQRSSAREIVAPEPARETLGRALAEAAEGTGFSSESRRIILAPIALKREPKTAEERSLVSDMERDLALIHAKALAHAAQHMLGDGMLSLHACLLPTRERKADVVLFFLEQGIDLDPESRMGFLSRYSESPGAADVYRGYQTEADAAAFRAAYVRTPIGGKLYIGSNAWAFHNPAEGRFAVSLQEPPRADLLPEQPSLEEHRRFERERSIRIAFANLLGGGVEAVLQRTAEGAILSPWPEPGAAEAARPAAAKAMVFAAGADGSLSRLSGPIALHPGQTFFIGRAYRFQVPESADFGKEPS